MALKPKSLLVNNVETTLEYDGDLAKGGWEYERSG